MTYELKKLNADGSSLNNHSLYFFADTRADSREICFFAHNPSTGAGSADLHYITAYSYRYVADKGLCRYERLYSPTDRGESITDVFSQNGGVNYLSNFTDNEEIIVPSDFLSAEDFTFKIKGSDLNNNSINFESADNQRIFKAIDKIQINLYLSEAG